MNLIVIGDSHSIIFGGNLIYESNNESRFNNVKIYHLGPALAYNLYDSYARELGKWGKIIDTIINTNHSLIHSDAAFLFIFGEIDIRTQVIKRIIAGKKAFDVVFDIVQRLFCLVLHISSKHKDKNIFILTPVGTMSRKFFHSDKEFPSVGNEFDRNYITLLMSDLIDIQAKKLRQEGYQIFSINIYELFVNKYETNQIYYQDPIHINFFGLSKIINKFKKICDEFSLPSYYENFNDLSLFFSDSFSKRDISAHCKVFLSSTFDMPVSLTFNQRGYCFHTKLERNPYALIDIGYQTYLNEIRLFNRIDMHHERACPLTVEVGNSPQSMIEIFRIDKVWGENLHPIIIKPSLNIGSIRFVKISIQSETYLHLGEVSIYEQSLLLCNNSEPLREF